MAKPKMKRQPIPGQFLLGSDPLGSPIITTVPLSPAYTRTHNASGLFIGGRSPREFYHPIPMHGVIYKVPNIVIYRWTDFSVFSLNANAYLSNGLTVDGLINPSSPSGGGLMMFTQSNVFWSDLGIPLGQHPHFIKTSLKCQLGVELPQFIGYDSGGSHEGGYIDDTYTNIADIHGNNLVNAGSLGINTPQWPYVTGYVTLHTEYDFSFVAPSEPFDIGVWINWNRPNGRFNLQSMEWKMLY